MTKFYIFFLTTVLFSCSHSKKQTASPYTIDKNQIASLKSEVKTIKSKKKGASSKKLTEKLSKEDITKEVGKEIKKNTSSYNIIPLAIIKSSYINKTYTLKLGVDKSNSIENFQVTNNKKQRTKIYPKEILNRPIVLVKTLGIKLVGLRCLNFNKNEGCNIEIEYPHNLTYGRFKIFQAKLKKDKSGIWRLYAYGDAFNNLELVPKKGLGILIGIKSIIPSYLKSK